QLGALCGLSRGRIGPIETFRLRPRPDEQQEIADALSVDRATLFPPEILDLYGPVPVLEFALPAVDLSLTFEELLALPPPPPARPPSPSARPPSPPRPAGRADRRAPAPGRPHPRPARIGRPL